MKNQQRTTPVAHSSGAELLVHSIFWTIQGEGIFAGRPAVFVRLGGCNLQCPLCDTEYTEGAKMRQVSEIVLAATTMTHESRPLVVITGGEPFRQNITPLCAQLIEAGATVQVETNGRLHPQDAENLPPDVVIVVAPKTATLSRYIEGRASAYKYVVTAADLAPDGLPRSALAHPLPEGRVIARPPNYYNGPIYVQPADEQDDSRNERNLVAAIRTVMDNPRFTLCLQLHKILGLE